MILIHRLNFIPHSGKTIERKFKVIIDSLIGAGADINTKNKDGISPLSFAEVDGNRDGNKIFAMLIKHKANIKGIPLHWAATNGDNRI